jgi:GAF domain-containing protein
VFTDDATADVRWPRLARVASGTPVRAVLAIPVADSGRRSGVLNVYGGVIGAFRPEDRRMAELVAAAVTGVLQSVGEREELQKLAANLEVALTSRAEIDQAKGVLMGRLGVSADDAFARLVTVSNRLNIKVRDLAQLVVEGHVDQVIAVSQ